MGGEELVNEAARIEKEIADAKWCVEDLTKLEKDLAMKFDPRNGKDVRQDLGARLDAQRYVAVRTAARDMGGALGYKGTEKFSGRTGKPLPEDLVGRLEVFRGDVEREVDRAAAVGVTVPEFDEKIGKPVPKWALRNLKLVQEGAAERADVELGLNILSRLRQTKASR
jgi:hypothetical protein